MPGHSHHFHLTKREDKRLIGLVCSVFAVLMSLTTLPQIHLIYTTKQAGGLSLLMWVLYSIGVIPFLWYGIIHKLPQLIILNALWLVVQLIMILGIILYG